MFDVRRFGAKGDGETDDTKGIQAAVNEAAACHGGVFFPTGHYRSSTIRLYDFVTLEGRPTWGWARVGGTCLHLCDDRAESLFNLDNAHGVRILGLALDGAGIGKDIIAVLHPGAAGGEGHLTLDRVLIVGFSGTGLRLRNACGYFVTRCMFSGNEHGIHASHFSEAGYIEGSNFGGNRGYGIYMDVGVGSWILNNRIEWNHRGGVCIENGCTSNIQNNQFDRSGGPGLILRGTTVQPAHGYSITGNLFTRSGAMVPFDSDACSHMQLEHVRNLTIGGNIFEIGKDDLGSGQMSPAYGIVLTGARDTVIKDNGMNQGALRQSILNHGGSRSLIIEDNPGLREAWTPPAEADPPVPPRPEPRPDRPAGATAAAVRRDALPARTGDLADPVWESIPAIGPFYRIERAARQVVETRIERAAGQATDVRILQDGATLLFGITCWEDRMDCLLVDTEPDERDRLVFAEDSVDLFLGSDRNAFWHLSFNAAGAVWDAEVRGGAENVAADLDWEAKTRLRLNRWTAEVRVPLAGVSFGAKVEQDGLFFNICRTEIPHNELSSWAKVSKWGFCDPDRFGRLRLY